MLHFEKCWTGRRWVCVGSSGIGFGPRHFVERIVWRGKLVWFKR